MKKFFLAAMLAVSVVVAGGASTAEAAPFSFGISVGGGHRGHGHHGLGYPGYGAYCPPSFGIGGGHYHWHDTSHYHYHPGNFWRHGNHYHYEPGHYHLHRSGHWDHHPW